MSTGRLAGTLALFALGAATTLRAQPPLPERRPEYRTDAAPEQLYGVPSFGVWRDAVRQGRFEARALGRDTIVSTYPRAAREVHFKFALNGRDNEFPPGIEHTINLRPRDGRIETPLYAFAVEPTPRLPRPEDAAEGEDGDARVTIRLDLRAVRDAIRERGWYKPPLGDTIRSLDRVTVIGDTDPLVWDISAVRSGAPQDLSDPDGDGIYEATLRFRTEYLRPLDGEGRAIWARRADLSQFPQLASEQPIMDALHRMALEELTELVREDGALAAGAKWPGVWTRDVSLAAVLSLAIVAPDAVKVSLRRKVDARGRIIQDTGTGGSWPISTDRMVWALAAWEVYAVTGDTAWLRESYDVIRRSALADAHAAHDPATGLVRGESTFEDWREQSYPRWMQPADIFHSFALGTNAVHLGAYRVLGDMARALGRPPAEIARWDAVRSRIGHAIDRHFAIEGRPWYAAFLYGRVSSSPSPRFDALGESLLRLEARDVVPLEARTLGRPQMPFGTPTFWPFIDGVPYYHNGTIWPFVTAYALWASARTGLALEVEDGIASLVRGAALFLTNKENLVAETGHFEGTALNSDRQLWSVAGMLAVEYRVLFGMRFERDRLAFVPIVPEKYGRRMGPTPGLYTRELRGLRYRGATLTVRLRGYQECQSVRARLDGVEIPRAEIPDTLTGEHTLELDLNGCHADMMRYRPSTPAVASPETPVARLDGTGTARALTWRAVPRAVRYDVFRDGRLLASTSGLRHAVTAAAALAEYQVAAIDSLQVSSFLSEPVRVILPAGERVVVPSAGSIRIEREAPPVELRLEVASAGRYALDALYSNGNGPINTEDKAALRTLEIDGAVAGVLVMPQRGAGNWDERGYTNPLIVTLSRGTHAVSVRWDALDENMNGLINTAIFHGLRVTRLPETP